MGKTYEEIYVGSNYSGTLGTAWFKEALKKNAKPEDIELEAKERAKYTSQIKQSKLDKIKEHKMLPETVDYKFSDKATQLNENSKGLNPSDYYISSATVHFLAVSPNENGNFEYISFSMNSREFEEFKKRSGYDLKKDFKNKSHSGTNVLFNLYNGEKEKGLGHYTIINNTNKDMHHIRTKEINGSEEARHWVINHLDLSLDWTIIDNRYSLAKQVAMAKLGVDEADITSKPSTTVGGQHSEIFSAEGRSITVSKLDGSFLELKKAHPPKSKKRKTAKRGM